MAKKTKGPKKDRLADAIGGAIGAVSNAAASRPRATLVVIALVTLGLGSGLAQVTFEENLLEILPRNHPDTLANLNLSEDFPGHHSYVNINFVIDPVKWEKANTKLPFRVPPEQTQRDGNDPSQPSEFTGAYNVSDEVYLRGLEEYYQQWAKNPRYLPQDLKVFNIAWNAHVKLINYTNSFDPARCESTGDRLSCFDPATYKFPGTSFDDEQRVAIDWMTVFTAAPDETSAQASPDWDVTRSVYVYGHKEPDGKINFNELGAKSKQAFLDYKAAAARGQLEWDVFDLDRSGITVANVVDDAHSVKLAKEDLAVLAPLVAVFILVALFLAFRSPKAVLVALGSLAIGTIWTYGAMGYMRIPLNTLNLTVVPLILGVGIDYSIHMTREYLEHRAEGHSDAESFREAGKRSGFAMLIATVITIAGLMIMAYSPSKLIAQMGLLSAIALAFVYTLAIVFIPAALVTAKLSGIKDSYKPSALMPRIGRFVTKHRLMAFIAILVITGGAVANTQFLFFEAFGNPALNFPRGDEVREWYESGQAAFFGTEGRAFESNWVIIEGDITSPETHEYIRVLQERLRQNPEIRSDSVTSIRNLVLQWEQLKQGTPAALAVIGQGMFADGTGNRDFDPYPQTQADIKRSLDEMYACECFEVYASLFLNRDYDMTVVLIDTNTGGTYEGAKAIIDRVEKTMDEDDIKALQEAAGVNVALGGYTAFSVLFIESQRPWMEAMAYASTALVVGIILIVWRDIRATLAIGSLVALTTVWWLGTLPMLGVGIAVTLTLPIVFINCIGSDYGLHLAWSAKKEGDMEKVLANTGKAVLFSVITTVGAFALFVPMTNLMMRRSMLATTVAILTIFVVTMLILPLFYPVKAQEADATQPVEAAAEDERPRQIVAAPEPAEAAERS